MGDMTLEEWKPKIKNKQYDDFPHKRIYLCIKKNPDMFFSSLAGSDMPTLMQQK